MQLARIAVVVEGAHDFAVLDAAAGNHLVESRCLLMRMQGAKNTAAMLDAKILVSMTDAATAISAELRHPRKCALTRTARHAGSKDNPGDQQERTAEGQ